LLTRLDELLIVSPALQGRAKITRRYAADLYTVFI
jgi:hypothetical protein